MQTLATSSPLDCGNKNDANEERGPHMSVPHPQALLMMQQQQQQQQKQQQKQQKQQQQHRDGLSEQNENDSSKEEINRHGRKRNIKHPVSAYVFYVTECKARLQHSRPDLSFGEIARIIGANWQKLSPADHEKVSIRCLLYHQVIWSDACSQLWLVCDPLSITRWPRPTRFGIRMRLRA